MSRKNSVILGSVPNTFNPVFKYTVAAVKEACAKTSLTCAKASNPGYHCSISLMISFHFVVKTLLILNPLLGKINSPQRMRGFNFVSDILHTTTVTQSHILHPFNLFISPENWNFWEHTNTYSCNKIIWTCDTDAADASI
jgi:hypothetical protein